MEKNKGNVREQRKVREKKKKKESVREWTKKENAVTAGNAERERRWAETIKAVRALGTGS